jgi:hypothetical protein
MRSITIDLLAEGMAVAKPVMQDSGRVLLTSGVLLTRGLVERLRSLGVQHVWVEGEGPGEGGLSEEAARELERVLEERFVDVSRDPLMRQIREIVQKRLRARVVKGQSDDTSRA